MKLKVNIDYMSLRPFTSEELSDFTVITGFNGSGKTQLINVIANSNSLKVDEPKVIEFSDEVVNILNWKFNELSNLEYNIDTWNQHKYEVFRYWNDTRDIIKDFLNYLYTNEIEIKDAISNRYTNVFKDKTNESISSLISNGYYRGSVRGSSVTPETAIKLLDKYLKENEYIINFIFSVSRTLKRHKIDILDEDFNLLNYESLIFFKYGYDLSAFMYILFTYTYKRRLNSNLYFDKITQGIDNASVSDKEYINRFPSPLSELNELLVSFNFKYKVKDIDFNKFKESSIIVIAIENIANGIEVNMSDLSSGEKILFNFYLSIFINKKYYSNGRFPDLILLDEPDAYLHPAGVEALIKSLNNEIVKKNKTKVILTTHSPTTVALSPDDSIFQLFNDEQSKLIKIDKDEALHILTANIPLLSISYHNHRQVIVESPTDLFYYQLIYNKLVGQLLPELKLYFISNGYGDGNCEQVISLVKSFRASGNTTVFGIIDWDNKNRSEIDENVIIHGFGNRYSLENYILEPIFLFVYFLEIEAYNLHSIFDLSPDYNQFSIGLEENDVLQRFSDHILNLIYKKYPAYKEFDSQRHEIEYANNKHISVPIWYLNPEKGHFLEDILKKSFPVFDSKAFSDTGSIQKKMSIIVGKCFPFVPIDSVKVIRHLIDT
ncbi:putative AbiEii toxin of type IV toxin-antitoxin system [Larkinella arboricola]|uniref:Putative AbiEii toxin of type IV toxin-antitoxin system n=1 Tax=Larkinella arboricola TaxID=643671 RepID=A0A327WWS6_LARAB|nr:AAA family ATPase [Larkinella arboricola]RAJ97593.1 putative AbiEii toxin of type IV toxin-antitoxin system [Larkinella arboricola]